MPCSLILRRQFALLYTQDYRPAILRVEELTRQTGYSRQSDPRL